MASDRRREDLNAAIARKIAAGMLPKDTAVRVRAGHGTGGPCDACGLPITSTQIAYENDMADGRTLRLHAACLAVWHAERVRAEP